MNTEELFIDASSLPPPLSKTEVNQLFQEIKEGSKEAREKVIHHNILLVLYRVTTRFQNVDYDKKELVAIGVIGLLNAVSNYDVKRGVQFHTYAARCIDNEILMFLTKIKKLQMIESIDKVTFYNKDGSAIKLKDKIFDDRDFFEDLEISERNQIIRELIEQLPKRGKEIIKLYFGFYDRRYTQKEIGEKFQISESYTCMLIAKNVEQLRNLLMEKKLIEVNAKLGKKTR